MTEAERKPIHVNGEIHAELKSEAARRKLKLSDFTNLLLEDQLERIKSGEIKLEPAVLKPA